MTRQANGAHVRRATVIEEQGGHSPHEPVQEHRTGRGVDIGPHGAFVLTRHDQLGEPLVAASLRICHAFDGRVGGKGRAPHHQEGPLVRSGSSNSSRYVSTPTRISSRAFSSLCRPASGAAALRRSPVGSWSAPAPPAE